MNPRVRIAGWMAIGAITGVLGTIQLQAMARGSYTIPLNQIQEFATAYGLIKTGYVEPTEDKQLIEDAITGMVSGLDPHSQYLNADDFKEFMDSTTGKFVGLGIEIVQEDGLIKIVSPIEDSPAHRAGLLSGDMITRIDKTEVRELTLQQAVQRMRGEPNTSVKLTVYRKSEDRTFAVNIVRAEIHSRSVKGEMIEPGYGWIRISQFQENTVDVFAKKINELYKQDPNMKGLVLDLRNDPGGLLNAAIAVSSVFLPEDALVVSTRGQNKEVGMHYLANPQYYLPDVKPPKTIEIKGNDGQVTYQQTTPSKPIAAGADPLANLPAGIKTIPLIVLVNEGSASASEIVAGALKDHKRATIMGATTFGKGSVQTTLMITDTSAIKMTIAMYYTPSNQSIQATGIVPDILLAEYEDGTSPLSSLYTREADLQRHITGNNEDKSTSDKLREERDAAIQKIRDAKDEGALPRMPEFGSKEDFRLKQALNQLQGKPVTALDPSKIKAEESKAETQTPKEESSGNSSNIIIRERVLEPIN